MTPIFRLAALGMLTASAAGAQEAVRLTIVAAETRSDAQAPDGIALRIRLDPESTVRLATLTRAQIGRRAVVSIDGAVIMRPMILGAIEGGGLSLIGIPPARVDAVAARLLDGRSSLTVGFEAAPGRR